MTTRDGDIGALANDLVGLGAADGEESAWDVATELIDLGWRPPVQTISSVEKLDGLKIGSVIRCTRTNEVAQRSESCLYPVPVWQIVGERLPVAASDLLSDAHGPDWVVLFESGA